MVQNARSSVSCTLLATRRVREKKKFWKASRNCNFQQDGVTCDPTYVLSRPWNFARELWPWLLLFSWWIWNTLQRMRTNVAYVSVRLECATLSLALVALWTSTAWSAVQRALTNNAARTRLSYLQRPVSRPRFFLFLTMCILCVCVLIHSSAVQGRC
jgi:hypothetical protein